MPRDAGGEADPSRLTADKHGRNRDRLATAVIAALCVSLTGVWGAFLLWGASRLILH